MFIPSLFIFCGLLWSSHALDNGVALTPPMGWLSWLRYNCTTDCEKYPTECISENLIKRTADAMASEGYLEAGYQYVTIDDCWPEKKRGPDGRLEPDHGRFPSGILALSRYVQSKGLKFGIYEDYGNFTCAGYPGVLGHEAMDVATFAEWEVDYVKLDGCGAPDPDTGYPMFGKLLNETGRPMVYSCSWPAYQSHPNYSAIAKACNIWRNYGDIQNNWNSVVNIMAWFGEKQEEFVQFAGPGNFNDPDMLVIGNSGLTVDQARVQMAVWSVLAAPLIMSAEISSIQLEFKDILLNKDVIAVNQDALGKQGLRIWTGVDKDEIWHRELSDGARALAFVNLRDTAANVSYTHEQMKLPLQDYILQMLVTFILLVGVSSSLALDNGLALTPPMGWLTWERFRCITDCKKYPNECISENLIKRTADLMVNEGYLDAGYEYLGIDDCWLEKKRGPDGRMVPDKERFPNGMKAVADYIHSRGLKFGMYEDYGNLTCAGYPGVLGNERLDIQTFVDWEIDYLKLDGCYIEPKEMDAGYPSFGKLLNETGRSILYSCSWPAYQEDAKMLPDYGSIAEHCNMWRNWDDIEDSWASLTKIMDWFGDNQERLAQHAGPGHWNDPDMLLIGNFGLTIDQARVQMAVWSILAAPLLMSVDLATIRPEFKEILLNKDIIAVNQDPMGKQGMRVWKKTDRGARSRLEIWSRELHDGAHALAFVSQRDDGIPYTANFTLHMPQNGEYEVHDLYKDEGVRHWNSEQVFDVRINPSGVKFYKFILKTPSATVHPYSKSESGSGSDAVVNVVVNKS